MTWITVVQAKILNQFAFVSGRALSYPCGLEVLHTQVRLQLREVLDALVL
jgi:enamine deaminase RidA (YjgF/YER057c/UK114 family)